MKNIQLTCAHALVKFLTKQKILIDGKKEPLFPGAFGIFGHGNVACLGQALEENSKRDVMAFGAKLKGYSDRNPSIDKDYFEKIAKKAMAGIMPDKRDIEGDTDPRDFVLDMMNRTFPKQIMKQYKGLSPSFDNYLNMNYDIHNEANDMKIPPYANRKTAQAEKKEREKKQRERAGLDEAKKSEVRQLNNKRKSFFDGIVLNWKDLFDIKKKKCEGGTQLLSGRISEIDAEVYKNAKNCGIITIGKTHLTELAFSGLGVNPKTGTPPNAVKQIVAPGGSSSGAAVATALNLSSAGIGSDTGGSVRIPAAWNNLVGFKPTHGKLSLHGVLKLCPNFDTVGPITKTVEDGSYKVKFLLMIKLENYLNTKSHG